MLPGYVCPLLSMYPTLTCLHFFMLSFCYFGECMHVLFALLNFKCQHPQPKRCVSSSLHSPPCGNLRANRGETQHQYDTACRNAPADVALSLLSPSQSALISSLPLPLWAGPYAPSNYQGYFLQRAKSLFMAMSVCHRALAVNPQDADSVDNPRENLNLCGCQIQQFCCFCTHLKITKKNNNSVAVSWPQVRKQ